jgi:gluconokinase
MGDRFHELTGCRYHPMFPVFKLAALYLHDKSLLASAARVVSIKSFFVYLLTGTWVEDHGMASATGLYNIVRGEWDSELLSLAGIQENQLPLVRARTELIGRVTGHPAREFGLAEDIAVVNGSGDGFLANVGSECESPERISVTLGTSGVARQATFRPVLDALSGTFCYRAADDAYLLGCAGNNGGNVLDWSRSIFGSSKEAESTAEDIPIFIPLLHGERSPEWNLRLTGSWHGLKARHTAADLARSILEGVVFNLAHYVEIVQQTSGKKALEVVLSGNGFLDPLAAPILATVVDASVLMPEHPGLASLRGSAICALRESGIPVPPLKSKVVPPLASTNIRERYRQYRSLRS